MARREMIFYNKHKPCSVFTLSVEEVDLVMQSADNMEAICQASEIFNLNNYTKISSPSKIYNFLQKEKKKPFVFFCNLN